MTTYNAAFFGLFENVFKLLKQEYGEERALELFSELMTMGLSKSYGNDFKKGDLVAFERMVGERDRMVGLKVEFTRNSANELIYQFHDEKRAKISNQFYEKLRYKISVDLC